MIYNGFKTGVLYGTTSGDRDAISRKYLIKYCNAKKCEYYARTESLLFIGVALKKKRNTLNAMHTRRYGVIAYEM